MSLNHITLLGRAAHAPELRYTQDGQPVTRLLLQVDRPEGSGHDAIRVIARRELAESIVGELARGDLAVAEGRLLLRTYVTRDGARQKVAEVEAQRIARVAAADPSPVV